MTCKHFGECNSCNNYEGGFEAQNLRKQSYIKELFSDFYSEEIQFFESPSHNYRARSEFRIWHDGEIIHYALNTVDKGTLFIEECPKVSESIETIMPFLLSKLQDSELKNRLFAVDFLSSSEGELCVSLLYHKKIDERMSELARTLESALNIHIILRARKQKVVLSQDYVTEKLYIHNDVYTFLHVENSFTQPNARVNEKMIEWSLEAFKGVSGDLLELYCGAGNFTIPFARVFDKVLATEISKSSINAAKKNMSLNDVENVEFIRMSAEEFTQALDGVREFRRMKEVDIKSYALESIFVDPPRAGLDEESCAFTSRFENIVYISCNPETLHRDIERLEKTHDIVSMAAFDQFVYTKHIEMGVSFKKRSEN